VKLAEADLVAERLTGQFAEWKYPRVKVVGSVRRRKPEPGDIEILAVPPVGAGIDAVRWHLEGMGLLEGAPDKLGRRAPNGPRYFRKRLPGPPEDVQVDVFLVLPPARWGIQELIRTGDAEFSHQFVTRLHRFGLRSEDGRLLDKRDQEVPCETELECFAAAHLAFIEPVDRSWEREATRAAVLGP
jgi:DNA polymerase/3'-5' exonuclease PolX